MQVIIFTEDGNTHIIQGDAEKVKPVADAVILAAPTPPPAFLADNTELSTGVALADPRVPTSAAEFNTKYPNNQYHYNEA